MFYNSTAALSQTLSYCSHTFPNATVEENAPGKPHGRGQIESVLFRVFRLGQLEATKGREAVQQIQDKGDHVDRQADQNPQSVLEGLQEGCQAGVLLGLCNSRRS